MPLGKLSSLGPVKIAIVAGAVVAVVASVGIAIAAAVASPLTSQFTVVKGTIRTATGTPKPASGSEAVLWGGSSYATTTIDGSGRIMIGAVGDECDGWPSVSVSINGQQIGATTIVSHTSYGTYGIGKAGVAELPAGSHQIRIDFVNDYSVANGCDRNVALGYARMESPTTSGASGSPTASPAATASKTPAAASPSSSTTTGFVHPGVSVSRSQLDLVKSKVAAGAEPWKSAYQTLQTQSISGHKYSSLTYVAHPVAIVKCATAGGRAYIAAHPERPELAEQGCDAQTEDAVAALTDALIWYVSGDAAYAQKSIEIMNAWSGTLTGIWFDQPRKDDGSFIYGNGKLQAAWTGETITRAAEIIRYTYTPAAGKETFNVPRFSTMLKNVILPLTIDNWTDCCANWLLSTTDATIAIGVFTDDRAVFNNGVGDWRNHVPSAYYLTTDKPSQPQLAGSPIPPPGTNYDKPNTTAATMKVYWQSPTKYVNGLGAETCRDLSHFTMGLEAMSSGAETARIQHIDLWGEQKTRLVAALELNASYVNAAVGGNLSPSNSVCSKPLALGGTAYQLGWEAAYNEYVNRLGLSLPQTKAVVARNRPTKSALHMTAATLLYGGVL